MKDIQTIQKTVVAIGPAVLDEDTESTAIDLRGFDAAKINIAVGVGGIIFDGDNKIDFVLTHGDTAGGDFVAVEAGDVSGVESVGDGGAVLALEAEHAAAAAYSVGYIGYKPFLKISADFTGTHGTGTPVAVLVEKAFPHTGPVSVKNGGRDEEACNGGGSRTVDLGGNSRSVANGKRLYPRRHGIDLDFEGRPGANRKDLQSGLDNANLGSLFFFLGCLAGRPHPVGSTSIRFKPFIPR